MSEPALDALSLRFSYLFDFQDLPDEELQAWQAEGYFAFHDLHLSVPRGSIYGLLGPNGSGKSTLLQMALGLLEVPSGQLRVLGIDPASDPIEIRRRVGYVPQKSDLDPEMTVDETLDFVRLFFADRWNREVVKEALDRFQLTQLGGMKVGLLSDGIRQRVSLVTALAIEPEMLILDEPTAGLDAVVRRHFADAVIDYMATGGQRTVVLSSHLLSEMEALVDHVGILGFAGNGSSIKLIQAPLDVLKERALVVKARSTDSLENLDCARFLLRISGRKPVTAVYWLDQGSRRHQVIEELEAAGVKNLRIGESSLDEIFVALVQGPSMFQRDLHRAGAGAAAEDRRDARHADPGHGYGRGVGLSSSRAGRRGPGLATGGDDSRRRFGLPSRGAGSPFPPRVGSLASDRGKRLGCDRSVVVVDASRLAVHLGRFGIDPCRGRCLGCSVMGAASRWPTS